MSVDIEMNDKFVELLRHKTKKAGLSIAREFAITSVRHFKEGFQLGGGQTDAGKWPKRKSQLKLEIKKDLTDEEQKELGRAILVKTGSLQRAIKIKSISAKSVVIGTDSSVLYADYINYGTPNMEAREFLGASESLMEKHKRLAERILEKELKKK